MIEITSGVIRVICQPVGKEYDRPGGFSFRYDGNWPDGRLTAVADRAVKKLPAGIREEVIADAGD
jgi:hypothetical protein